jgi:hypothetical protein
MRYGSLIRMFATSRLGLRILLLGLVGALVVSPARAWDEIQSGVMREAPECVSWMSGRVDCLTRLANGHLSWVYLANGKWSEARDLGGALAAAPSCVVRGPNGLNCFATSAKGVLATINLNGATWSKWASLGGDLIPTRISCVFLARDRIACFGRGRQGQLMMRKWAGGKTWEDWRNLGGALSADPDCIPVNGAAAACFGRAVNGELAAFLPDPTGKTGAWSQLGGRIEGRPSCVRLKSGDAACVAQGRSGRLHMWRGMPLLDQSAGITTSSDEVATGEPACALESSTLVCFIRNAQGQLVRRSLGSGADTTRDGILESPTVAATACLAVAPETIGCIVTDSARRLQFAAGPKLAAGAPEAPTTAADEGAEGAWYLSNLQTGGACRVQLSPEVTFGAKRLRVGPACRRIGLRLRPTLWDQDESELLFISADGHTLVRFHSTRAGRWISPQREAAFLLTREPPEETGEAATLAEAPSASAPQALPEHDDRVGLFGAWRVLSGGRATECTVEFTDLRAGGGYGMVWNGPCGPRYSSVRYWAESGPALVFLGADEMVVARFNAGPDGKWHTDALGGMTLSR